jgi:hypothetical protein
LPREIGERQPRKRPELVPKTQQVKGRDHEPGVLKSLGARPHANSGAGTKKGDGSTSTQVIELKLAGKQFTITGKYLAELHTIAAKQGKEARLRIYIEDQNITLDGTVHLGR